MKKVLALVLVIWLSIISGSYAQQALTNVSENIAESLKSSLPKNINIAVWNIYGNARVQINPDDLRDSLEIAIVKNSILTSSIEPN